MGNKHIISSDFMGFSNLPHGRRKSPYQLLEMIRFYPWGTEKYYDFEVEVKYTEEIIGIMVWLGYFRFGPIRYMSKKIIKYSFLSFLALTLLVIVVPSDFYRIFLPDYYP